MGERKQKKRGLHREIIVPLPLDSALNRLNNRAGQCQAAIILRDREDDLVELDLSIGFYRYQRYRYTPNEYWKTRLTLESTDTDTTKVNYSVIRLQVEGVSLLLVFTATTVGLVFLNVTNLAASNNIVFITISIILWSVTLLVLWVRLCALRHLLHNLDKPLGEY